MNGNLLIAAACFAAAVSSVALAEDDVMATRYGNTTLTVDARGVVARIYYNADHTFTGTQGDLALKGVWTLEDNRVCRMAEVTPPGQPNPYCQPVQARAVGEHWSVGEGAGKVSVTIVKGR